MDSTTIKEEVLDQSTITSDVTPPSEPETSKKELPLREDNSFKIFNLSVRKEDRSICYSCGSIIQLNGKDLLANDKLSFADLYNHHGLQLQKIEQLFNYTDCENCKAKVLLYSQIPYSRSNNAIQNDLVYNIRPEHEGQMKVKLLNLLNYYRLILTYNNPQLAQLIRNRFPHFCFFYVQKLNQQLKLRIPAWIKQTSLNLEQLQQCQKDISNLLGPLMKSQTVTPSYTGNLSYDGLGIDFYNIDSLYNNYQSLLFLDIDGTSTRKTCVSNLSSKLSLLLFKLLALLEKKKLVKTVINSGRPIEWIMLFMLDVGLTPLAIGNNGNVVSYYRTPYDLTKPVLYIQKAPTKPLLMQIANILRHKYHLNLIEFIPLTGASPHLMISDVLPLSADKLSKLINQDPQIVNFLKDNNIPRIICEYDGQSLIHLSSSQYTKGLTGLKLLNALNIPKDKVFCIGNHYNDAPLAQIVGSSYAVGNALNQFKEVVTNVCEKNEASGALEAIRHFLLDKGLCTSQTWSQLITQIRQDIDTQMDFLNG